MYVSVFQVLIGDSSQLRAATAFDLVSETHVEPPGCDMVFIGFSCRCFSALNNSSSEFEHAIEDESGSSGQTAADGLSYVRKKKPAVVIIENVPGLATGYYCKDAAGDVFENPDSNLGVLFAILKELGYFRY